MMERLLRFVPAALSRRMGRLAVPLLAVGVLVVLLLGLAVAALVTPGTLGLSAARISQTQSLGAFGAPLDTTDADHDGLPDSLENYLYGSDPGNWNSSGLGIPDGWLAQYGYDPLSPLTAIARGAAPPADVLPPAYAKGYPAAYAPPLAEYYAFGLPAGYQPGVDAPWWNQGKHADPKADATWDGKGVPQGWLLHYGLPADTDPTRIAPGSTGNLTVREAFEANTNPLKSDSDQDGIDDWVEIHVTHTDPSKFSTSGTGIADGWALHYHIDPFSANAASQDPDRDGLTNLEEFQYSYNVTKSVVATFTKGLDPNEWETAHTGIPDGWYVKYDLSPFGEDVDRVICRASQWPEYRANGLPDFNMTIKEAYSYGRPSTYDEATQGVWWDGTNPASCDTDNDGIPDPVEIRGWYVNVTTLVGPDAKPQQILVKSNPLEADSDGDGLSDLEEYRGSVVCAQGQPARTFPLTNPRNPDTAFSGLSDYEKVCGAVRGDVKYDLKLDPTRADSAGDLMKDGDRLNFWHERYQSYKSSARYPYNGSAYPTLFEWTSKYARFAGMTHEQIIEQFRPDGDVDGDGILNVVDPDPSGGLQAARFGASADAKDKVYILGGPRIDPTLYRQTEFASPIPHAASDPANPDTDGDGLPDSWEIRYGVIDPAIGGWNLDPSKHDSDANGVDDNKENFDHDVVVWYGYNCRAQPCSGGASIERLQNTFSYTNDLKYAAGTNPNKLSSSDDGVPDGWKVFWSSRIADDTFPNLLVAHDPRVGNMLAGDDPAAQARYAEASAALSSSLISPTANLKDVGAKSTGYVRMICQIQRAPKTAVPGCEETDLPVLNGDAGADKTCAGIKAAPLLVSANKEVALSAQCLDANNLDNAHIKVLPIHGNFALTYAAEARLRTNPYLQDSDGDGVPDAYEAYYFGIARAANPTAQFPDPAAPDGTRSGEGNGVTLEQKCRAAVTTTPTGSALQCTVESFNDPEMLPAGADPLAADSDRDSILDDIELARGSGLNALDPSDLSSFVCRPNEPCKDSDEDGKPDFVELSGWGKNLFGVDVRTDPKNADSDGDGLLDGGSRTLDPVANKTLLAKWLAQGIAHTTNAQGQVTFLGEAVPLQTSEGAKSVAFNPTKLDTFNVGIPDGWLFANSVTDFTHPPLDAYQGLHNGKRVLGSIPTWWDPKKDGVWWWGEAPGSTACDVPEKCDLMGDGLNDLNGEDPLPMRFEKQVAPGVLTMEQANAWVHEPGADEHARAQIIGDGAGDPKAARSAKHTDPNGVETRLDKACTFVTDVVVNDSTSAMPIITKGKAFNVTGRLVLQDCYPTRAPDYAVRDPIGVPHRTILVSLFGPDASTIVGANFTRDDGTFRVQANLTADQIVKIPTPGMALLGQVAGDVPIHFDPDPPVKSGATSDRGTNAIVVWATNTSPRAAPGSPTYGDFDVAIESNGQIATKTGADSAHATAFNASSPVPIIVRSSTSLERTVGASAVNGGALVGDVRLLDAAGGGVPNQPVALNWGGVSPSFTRVVSTDSNGRINVTNLAVPVRAGAAGSYPLTATFSSSDANLLGSSATWGVSVLNPTAIDASLDATAATVGQSVTLSGTLSTVTVSTGSGDVAAKPVAGATLRVNVGSLDITTRTDDNGIFRARLDLPGTLSAGNQSVAILFPGDASDATSEEHLLLAVKRTANIIDLQSIEGPRTAKATLRGTLVDNAGEGFAGPIEARASLGGVVARASADESGLFNLVVPLGNLALGAQQLEIAFPGDANHARASNFSQARVTSATTIQLDDVQPRVVRGDTFPVSGHLLDDFLQPVPNQAVAPSWRGEKLPTLVTDAAGAFAFNVPTNRSERPAVATLGLAYRPSATSIYSGSAASAALQVLQGVTIELPAQRVHRGVVGVTGVLLDDEGHPVPGAQIQLAFAGAPFGSSRTARNGTFHVERPVPDGVPLGPVEVSAHYAGTDVLAALDARSAWSLQSPYLITYHTLGPFVRGEPAPVDITVTDDAGAPLDAALAFRLGDANLGGLGLAGGSVRAAIPIPADTPRGAAVLHVSAPATPQLEAYAQDLDVVVKIRPKVDVHLPSVAVRGFSVGGGVTLRDDQGQPLRNTTFAYAFGNENPVTGQTDADGKATFASVAPLTGDASLALTVRGSGDVVGSEYRTSAVKVIGPGTPIGYLVLILAVLAVLAIIGLVILIAVLRRRQLTEARDIIEDAIQDLLAGNEYQGTIFLAYRRFSAHLARFGFAEKTSDTPREFAVTVRKALPVGAAPLRELIKLFEEARYSDHAIGSGERDRAVDSLASVRNELDRLIGRKKVAA